MTSIFLWFTLKVMSFDRSALIPKKAPAHVHAAKPRPVAPQKVTGSFPCTVTAYYTPTRDQGHFLMGSYEAEVRMEGGGNTASGKPVGTLHIAASKSFPFGTQIKVGDLGTYTVYDRGGAIKGTRIDMWMGVGAEGRDAAVAFGKKHLTCTRL